MLDLLDSVQKISKPKKSRDYHRYTISLGAKDTVLVKFIEQFIKDKGTSSFSEYVRKLLLFQLVNDPLYNRYKEEALRAEKKQIAEQMEELSQRANIINTQLKKYQQEEEVYHNAFQES
jgi:hypothetical protein